MKQVPVWASVSCLPDEVAVARTLVLLLRAGDNRRRRTIVPVPVPDLHIKEPNMVPAIVLRFLFYRSVVLIFMSASVDFNINRTVWMN